MPARDSDVVSIDAIINAAYDGISGPAGQKRDWERDRTQDRALRPNRACLEHI